MDKLFVWIFKENYKNEIQNHIFWLWLMSMTDPLDFALKLGIQKSYYCKVLHSLHS